MNSPKLPPAFGFQVMFHGSDRHGSYVWEAGKRDDLERFVTLALTEVSPAQLRRLAADTPRVSAKGTTAFLAELGISARCKHAYRTESLKPFGVLITADSKLLHLPSAYNEVHAALSSLADWDRASLNEIATIPR